MRDTGKQHQEFCEPIKLAGVSEFGAVHRALVYVNKQHIYTPCLDPPTTLNWNLIVLIWWYLESNRR